MTATFGKLEHETLTLKPGLNIIQAPNEWGKSTWCAFLVAMLYGIETRVHTTKAALADKERYAPWSGSPMSGRIELNWNGRDITIERSSKGRSVFGVFRAYETQSGLDIPELNGTNCGQMLLGVEKSVFTRSGFLRLTDLPVTQDEALRRRLNALVTTGDESGTADALSQKLKDLKNRCRLNRSTGLLPQAEAQRAALEGKLRELRELQEQHSRIRQRQAQLEEYHAALENHMAALQYSANQAYGQKLAAAQQAQADAEEKVNLLQAQCAGLPAADEVEQTLLRIQQLLDTRDSLHMEAQMLPAMPQAPEVPNAFREVPIADVLQHAQTDVRVYGEAVAESNKRLSLVLGILLAIAGAACLLIPHWIGKALGIAAVLVGLLLCRIGHVSRKRAAATAQALLQRYHPLDADRWETAAEEYARTQADYRIELQKYSQDREDLNRRNTALQQETAALTQGHTLAQCRQAYLAAQAHYKALSEAKREHYRANELLQALQSSHKEVLPPPLPDTMTHSPQETARLLSDCTYEQRQLHGKLGHCQGQMEALGQESDLQKQLDGVNERIRQLEDIYAALEIAQQTLSDAAAQLQRRFAPRISQRAQALFGKLTGGRYTRLTLGDDLSVHAGAQQEDTLRSALWRSDGTMDQLYLCVRLAVAEELTPQAPLILDDALVRFDRQRLEQAMAVLKEAAESKQVILFTCQDREAEIAFS